MNDNLTSEVLTTEMPMLALRGLTVFPGMSLNFDVERLISLNALNRAMEGDRKIFLLTQKDIAAEFPVESDLYKVGTVCTVRQFVRIPGGGVKVLVEGLYRAKLVRIVSDTVYFVTEVMPQEESRPDDLSSKSAAYVKKAFDLFSRYSRLTSTVAKETVLAVYDEEDPGYLADYIAQNTPVKVDKKQQVLEILDPLQRIECVCRIMTDEIEVAEIEHEIDKKLYARMGEQQRTNILREQMSIIRSELGMDASDEGEFDEYRSKITDLALDEEIEKKLLKEVDKLERQPFGSVEATVIRNYLDACIELPWNITTGGNVSVSKARAVLEEDHFGLEKVKERILEFLAVKQYAPESKGTILCLVGPP